tara:strand:+ start:264 stop:1313 length:1050 start_codon:yes stop_codon:yes gene_type:complete
VVGAGFGRYGLVPAFRRDNRCEVVAIAASSGRSAQTHAETLGISRAYGNWRDLLEDEGVDAVAVATPPAVQPSIIKYAMSRNLAVFAEKPLATSLEAAQELEELARAAGLPNVIDFIFPELDTWRLARSKIQEGAIGALHHFVVNWQFESYDHRNGVEGWKTDGRQGGGALQHFVSHCLYYIEWLVGPIGELMARVSTVNWVGRSGDTLVSLSFKLETGVPGALIVSSAANHGSGHSIEVYGSEGSLRLTNESHDPVRGFRLSVAGRTSSGFQTILEETDNESDMSEDGRVLPVSRLANRFLDWCSGDKPTMPTFRDGLRVQYLIDAVKQSDELRRGVRIENVYLPTES